MSISFLNASVCVSSSCSKACRPSYRCWRTATSSPCRAWRVSRGRSSDMVGGVSGASAHSFGCRGRVFNVCWRLLLPGVFGPVGVEQWPRIQTLGGCSLGSKVMQPSKSRLKLSRAKLPADWRQKPLQSTKELGGEAFCRSLQRPGQGMSAGWSFILDRASPAGALSASSGEAE